MKIVVCIKQVPDTKGGVKFNPDGTLDRGAMLAIMNPDDKAGLEAALRLKDEYGAEVTVVTMGLPKAEEVLREALAMGADKGLNFTPPFVSGTCFTQTTIFIVISLLFIFFLSPVPASAGIYIRMVKFCFHPLSVRRHFPQMHTAPLCAVFVHRMLLLLAGLPCILSGLPPYFSRAAEITILCTSDVPS